MKALSIRQPWAALIADGLKTVEDRSWATDYRGPLAIHASSGIAVGFSAEEVADLPRGAVVAIANLIDCRPLTPADTEAAGYDPEEPLTPAECVGRFAWVLADAREIAPVAMKGALRLWECPDELLPLRYRVLAMLEKQSGA